MKRGIFLKTLLALILVGIIPLLVFWFLIMNTYQEFISKYISYFEELGLVSEVELIYKDIKIQVVFALSLVLILIILINTLITRKIVSPIRKLVEFTKALREGKFIKLKIKTEDEFEELADSFNQMAEELKKSRSAIEEAKTVLEIKVEARTKELEELTESLDKQVKERTKELEEKIEELEKFRKLAVGRELKMIELKKEIERLKEELKAKK